jgi:hypothetical protein
VNERPRQDFDDDPVDNAGENGTAGEPKTAGLTLYVALDDWPPEPVFTPKTPLNRARLALIDCPGQVHRLAGEFGDREQASQVASGFAAVSPDELPSEVHGHFAARPFRDGEGAWRVAVCYEDALPTPVFPDFHSWVGEWLVPVIRRPLKSGSVWCPQWWRHAEVVARLHSLWHAWESARSEGEAAMSYWWTMHFDPHFAVLTDSTRGPFAACKEQVHDATKPGVLPCEPPPSDWDWPGGRILGV